MLIRQIKENLFKERSRWFPWIPVLFGMGIVIYFALPFEPSLWLGAGLIEAIIFLALIFRRNFTILGILSIVGIITLGFAVVQLRAAYINKTPFISEEQKLYLKGRIASADANSRGNIRLLLEDISDFDDTPIPGKYKITLLSKKAPAEEGQCVEMIAKIMPPYSAAVIGGYQFDRKTFFENIKATGYSVSRALPVECLEKSSLSGSLKLKIEQIRNEIVNKINAVLPPDEAAVTAAIVAGERSGMSRRLTENYRDSGLAHFLSISGLHMSMLAGMMFFLVRAAASCFPPLIARYDTKKAAAVLSVFMSALYLLVSGAEIPAQRSFIMIFIVLLGILLGRQALSILTISWAALVVLLLTPEALVGASFQMSFAAVVALIAFYERYAGNLHRFLHGGKYQNRPLLQKTGRIVFAYIVGILTSDFVASLATLPFSIYHFNQIAVYTTIGNLLAGPVIGLIIMPFVLISLLALPLGLEELPLKIVGFGVHLVNETTAWVASLPNAGLPVLSMPSWGLGAIVLGGLWLCIWLGKWRLWGWLGIILGTLSLLTTSVPDVMIDESGKAVAVKDNTGRLIILPSRGKNFVKSIWLEKTGNIPLSPDEKKKLNDIWNGRKRAENQTWIDLRCNSKKKQCVYKGRVTILKNKGVKIDGRTFDSKRALGAAVRLHPDHAEIRTIRAYVGSRYWN